MAYADIEPFGEERADLRIGYAIAALMNAKTKGSNPYRPSDFMPDLSAPPQPPTTETLWRKITGRFSKLVAAGKQ